MPSHFILALDQGTTSSRSMVFDKQGNIISVAQKEFKQIFPQPGWVEHDAEEIWSTQFGTMAAAMARADIKMKQIAGIGITNQRETTVVWERKTGKPICNAIVWQDRRTAAFCDELKAANLSELIKQKLVNELGRSITIYKGERGYLPGKFEVSIDCDIIFTVITRLELRKLKNLVYEADPKAFVFANTIKEASGGVLKRRHTH